MFPKNSWIFFSAMVLMRVFFQVNKGLSFLFLPEGQSSRFSSSLDLRNGFFFPFSPYVR